MAGNKAPRHSRKHRQVRVPLTKSGYDTKALELHIYVNAAIEATTFQSLETLARRLGAITAAAFAVNGPMFQSKDAGVIAINSMHLTLESIQKRFEKHNVWMVVPEEAVTLRAAAGKLDLLIRDMPYNVLKNAEALVNQLAAIPEALIAEVLKN